MEKQQTDRLQRGEEVVVRDAWDKAVQARVWEHGEQGVLVLSQQEWERFTAGDRYQLPIAVPIEDVFKPESLTTQEGQILWEELEPMFP